MDFIKRFQEVTANISQLRFFSSSRLYNKQGSLDADDYNKTKQAFYSLFCINSPSADEGGRNVGNPKNTSIVSQSDIQLSSEYTKEYMKEITLGKWKHFKGDTYTVIGVAKHSENPDDEYVVYIHPDKDGNDQMWIRPVAMFLETIERDGKTMKRFEYLGD